MLVGYSVVWIRNCVTKESKKDRNSRGFPCFIVYFDIKLETTHLNRDLKMEGQWMLNFIYHLDINISILNMREVTHGLISP